MAKEIDLKNEKINRLFFYYFFPSLLSMLSLSTHAIVDGFFVALPPTEKSNSQAMIAGKIGQVIPRAEGEGKRVF